MQFNQDIKDRVTKLAAQGHDIASRQEAGMSETPLSDLFNGFRGGKRMAPVEIAVVGLDANSVPLLLSSVLGQDYPLCRVVIPDRLGYAEIHLREHGFIFENAGERQEFDQASGLLQAIEQSRASGEAQSSLWSDPVRLSMQAPAGRSGVILLIPDSLSSLTNKPALLSVLATRAGFLVIAGRSDHQLNKDDKLTLTNLLENMGGLQCVVTDEASVSADARAKISWLTWPKSGHVVPTHFLASPGESPFLPFLDSSSPQAAFKDYLSAQRTVNQMEETLGLLDESIQAEQDQLAGRLRLVDSGATGGMSVSMGGDSETRQLGEDQRARIQEDLETIKKNREDAAKRSLLVGGDFYQRLTDIANSLQVEDIQQDPKDAVVKLSLSDAKLEDVTSRLQQETKQVVMTDLAVIEETVGATKEEAEAQLAKLSGVSTRMHLEPVDRNAWWDAVVSAARPEIKYRSEMAATTLAKRFSEARGGLSMVMVAAGMLTGLQAFVDPKTLASIKTMIYGSMIPVLVIGLLWTFVSVKKKNRMTLEKELERLREGVLAELRKVAGELLRAQGAQISTHLGKVGKQLNTQAGDVLKKHEAQTRGAKDEEQRKAKERNRGIEQRSREKTQMRSEIGRLQSSLADIRRMLADWNRALNAPPGPAGGLPSFGMPSYGAPGYSAPAFVPTVAPSPSRVFPPGA